MLQVSQSALAPFRAAGEQAWAIETSEFIARTYLDYLEALDIYADDLLPICDAVRVWGARFNVTSSRELKQLSCLALSLGHRFWCDPRFGHYVMSTVEDTQLPRPLAIRTLVENGTEWLEGLWQDDSVQEFGERLCALIAGGYSPTSANLKYVLPGHSAMFSPENEEQLLKWLRPRLPATQYDHQRLAYICLALPFGTGWWTDPQYRNIAHHVAAQSDPQTLVNRILPIFRALP